MLNRKGRSPGEPDSLEKASLAILKDWEDLVSSCIQEEKEKLISIRISDLYLKWLELGNL